MRGANKTQDRILHDLSKQSSKQEQRTVKRAFLAKLQKDAKREQRMERFI